jgi:DNA topoisomerase IA
MILRPLYNYKRKGKIPQRSRRQPAQLRKSSSALTLTEGEAIVWHIAEELTDKDDNIYRVLFMK